MQPSLSGTHVKVETVLYELPLAEVRTQRQQGDFRHQTEWVTVPEGHCSGGVPPATYAAYRQGLDSACADIVICTVTERGPAVLAIKRNSTSPFGNKWWVQGGAEHGYRSILDFLAERAEKECGVRPGIEGLIGFYRTCAPDRLASTTQPCYVATVPEQAIKQAKADKDHDNWALFTLSDLKQIPEAEQHWYPMRVFWRALVTMP